MLENPPAIGIDLGTTKSCVAVYEHGIVKIIPNEYGTTTTPSCVAFTERECLIGQAAKDQMATNVENTVYNIKRLIGRRFEDEAIQIDIKYLPFSVINDSGKPKIEVFFALEFFFQRQATKNAAQIAGINVLSIINEPTAAAMAYNFKNKKQSNRNILVCDLGGGTFDASVIEIENDVIEVKSTAGDTHLGGEDIDSRMVDYFVGKIIAKQEKDISNDKRALRRLRTACEEAKCALSKLTEFTIVIPALFDGFDYISNITRDKFEEISLDLFVIIMATVEKVILDARIDKGDVDEIILVGGSSRLPTFRKMLQDYFGVIKMSISTLNPEEAIAYGAAVQAAILDEDFPEISQDFLLFEINPMSIGIETQGGIMEIMIPRNSTIPTKQVHYASTDYPNGSVRVFEGERQLTKDNYFLGEFHFNLEKSDKKLIEITFEIGIDEIIRIYAIDTKSSNKIIDGKIVCGLTQKEIEQIMEQTELDEEQDKWLQQQSQIYASRKIQNKKSLQENIDLMLSTKTPFTITHKWRIEKFERLFSTENYTPKLSVVYSETFPESNKLKFSIRLLPKYLDETDQITYLSLFLYMKQYQLENETISANYELSIINYKEKKLISNGETKNFKEESSHGWDKFVRLDYLLDQAKEILQDGNLIILCETKIFADKLDNFDKILNNIATESRFNCDLKVNQVNRLWEIEQFSTFFYRTDASIEKHFCIQSKSFPETNENLNKYYLRLWPKGIDEQSNDFVSIFLYCEKFDHSDFFQYRLSILDRCGEFFHSGEGKIGFTFEKKLTTPLGQGSAKFLPIDSIFDPKNGLLPGDKLTIFCEIEEVLYNNLHTIDSSMCTSVVGREILGTKEKDETIIEPFMINFPPPRHVVNYHVALEFFLFGCTDEVQIPIEFFNPDGITTTTEIKTFKVEIKPGTLPGKLFEFEQENMNGNIPIQVVVVVCELEHDKFMRNGPNIVFTHNVESKADLIGKCIQIPTLEGDLVQVEINAANLNNLVIPFYGLPYHDNPSLRGDLIVHFEESNQSIDPIERIIEVSLKEILPGSEDKIEMIPLPGRDSDGNQIVEEKTILNSNKKHEKGKNFIEAKVENNQKSKSKQELKLKSENEIEKSCEINILLLGQTGAGKSTTVNAFSNYLAYPTYEEAVKSLKNITEVLSTKLHITDPKTQKVKSIKFGPYNGNDNHEMNPVTREPIEYTFKYGSYTVRIIDTPGIGCDDGTQEDNKNFDKTFQFLQSYKYLNAILIIVNGNNHRKIHFQYWFTELLTRLDKNTLENIKFCFTHSAHTDYTAGEAFSKMKSVLNETQQIPNLITMQNSFFIDHEAFLDIIPMKYGIAVNEKREKSISTSWHESAKNIKDLLERIIALPPHELSKTIALNQARNMILDLNQPLIQINKMIKENCNRFQTKKLQNTIQQHNQSKILLVEELKREKAVIIKIYSELNYILKENSFLPHNKYFQINLDRTIKSRLKNNSNADELKITKSNYQKSLNILRSAIDHNHGKGAQIENVQTLKNQFLQLKYIGQNLEENRKDTKKYWPKSALVTQKKLSDKQASIKQNIIIININKIYMKYNTMKIKFKTSQIKFLNNIR